MAIQTEPPMEMGRYLRQLVDNSLEEGQFEGAVATLDQLRSPDHRPSIIHILHLIYMSLHSTSRSCRLDAEGTHSTYDDNELLKSPRKMVKASKTAIVLSPEAVAGAQRLLLSFLATNGPLALSAALPQYPESEAAKRQMNSVDGGGGVQFMSDYVDSAIYAQAIAVKNAKSVWEVVKEGFAERASIQAMGNSKGKGRARSGFKTRGLVKEGSFGDLDEEELKPVGDNSWMFLEWLVALFETDANAVQARGAGKYSPLLLRQLPPPPGGTNVRWESFEPVKVALYALEQDNERHQQTGLRLLKLIIDLTYHQHLNLASFTSAVIAQFTHSSESTKSSPENSPDNGNASDNAPLSNPFGTLLDLLPNTLATLQFKISLCHRILQDATGAASSSSRPAPRARAAPGSLRNGHTTNGSNVANGVASTTPDLGINPATGLRIVSAMKKPTPRPRPRADTITAASVAESTSSRVTNDIPNAPLASPMAMVASGSGSTSSLPTENKAVPVVPSPRPRIPPFVDVAQAVKAQSKYVEPRQTRNGVARHHDHAQAISPWSVPSVLLRVRFELLLSCAEIIHLLSQRAAEEASAVAASVTADEDGMPGAPPPSAGSVAAAAAADEVLAVWAEALKESDGRFAALVDQVFGTPRPGETETEKEDRAFYADVVRAHAGYTLKSYGT